VLPQLSQLLKIWAVSQPERSVDLAANRIDLQELPELLRQIRFECCTLFLGCNGPRNRCSSLNTCFLVRPLALHERIAHRHKSSRHLSAY